MDGVKSNSFSMGDNIIITSCVLKERYKKQFESEESKNLKLEYYNFNLINNHLDKSKNEIMEATEDYYCNGKWPRL